MVIGNIKSSSSSNSNIITVTGATNLTLGNDYIIAMGASSYPLALLTDSSMTGKVYGIKCRQGNKTTSVAYVATAGNTTNVLTAGTVIYIVFDGTNWQQF